MDNQENSEEAHDEPFIVARRPVPKRRCHVCSNRRVKGLYVFTYYFSWMIITASVYLGGVDAKWLFGYWTFMGLLLFPAVFYLAKKAWPFVVAFCTKEVWECMHPEMAENERCAFSKLPSYGEPES